MRPRLPTSTIFAAIVATTVCACGATAEEAPSPFEVFTTRCIDQWPRYDQTVAVAKDREWDTLADDMTLSIQPLEKPTAFAGWVTQTSDDKPFEALVVAKATVAEKSVESCTMAFAGIDAVEFERVLVATKHAIPSGQQDSAVRVRKFFTVERDGFKEAVTLDLPIYPNGADEVVASVVAEQQIEN